MKDRKFQLLPLRYIPEYNTREVIAMRIYHCILIGGATLYFSKEFTDSQLVQCVSTVLSCLTMEYIISPCAWNIVHKKR